MAPPKRWKGTLSVSTSDLGEGCDGIAHHFIDACVRLRQIECLFQNADAQTVNAGIEIRRVVIGPAAAPVALPAVEPVGPGDNFEKESVVGNCASEGPDVVEPVFHPEIAGARHEPKGRLHADHAAA